MARNVFAAINYGIEVSGTIEKPDSYAATSDGTDILEWNGSARPTEEVLEAAWIASGSEAGVADGMTKKQRRLRFQAEADPLFFQYQRGEIEKSVYDAKIAEIRADLPLSTD